jgi:hypothetical protein
VVAVLEEMIQLAKLLTKDEARRITANAAGANMRC